MKALLLGPGNAPEVLEDEAWALGAVTVALGNSQVHTYRLDRDADDGTWFAVFHTGMGLWTVYPSALEEARPALFIAMDPVTNRPRDLSVANTLMLCALAVATEHGAAIPAAPQRKELSQ